MLKNGCDYCYTVPESQSESVFRTRARVGIIAGIIMLILLTIGAVTSLPQKHLTDLTRSFLIPVSVICFGVSFTCTVISSMSERYLFQDVNGMEHLHTEQPIRVGESWHCNTPDRRSIKIRGYILAIGPNGWTNKTNTRLLNPVSYSWKEIQAYSAYHSDSIELRDHFGKGLRVSVGEVLTIINNCDNWDEYKHQTYQLGVSMCLAKLQAQSARQTQPSLNAAEMRRTLTRGLSGFRDQKQVAKWEESARLEFKRLYPGSSLTAEEMSPEPTQPSETVA